MIVALPGLFSYLFVIVALPGLFSYLFLLLIPHFDLKIRGVREKSRECHNHKIKGKAMIRNRYNYPTPPIRDIKGKET